jgi:hypothetical protein
VDVKITGLDALSAALSAFPDRLQAAKKAAAWRIGAYAREEAKKNANKSPTKKLHSKTLKRKRISARRQFFSGGLERSIMFEVNPQGDAAVYVASNSEAGAYAKYIHDEKGKKWWKRGAGTIAKGPRADEKFIERAVYQNADKFKLVYEDEIKKEIAKL